jgi:hypothetical protein
LTVWKFTCPTADADDTSSAKPLTINLENWSKRYIQIQSIPNASGTPGGNQGIGSQGGGNENEGGGSQYRAANQ